MRMRPSELWGELARAARSLARSPGFTAVVVLTLALGVGANTAVFTVLDATLLEPLPYPEADRLVRLYEGPGDEPGDLNFLRGPSLVEYREWDGIFESVGVLYTYRERGADLVLDGQPRRIVVSSVAAGFFETLGVPPHLGRSFREDESLGPGDEPSRGQPGAYTVILSHGLWQSAFGGDPGVLGRRVELDDRSYEVVGVAAREFRNPFGSEPDAWIPQDLRRGGYNNWGNFYLSAVARLRDGLEVEAARDRIEALHRRMVEAEPEAGESNWRLRLVPLRDAVVGGDRRAMLWILAAAVALVLLSACVNVGNLVFARGLARSRELAIRGAMGSRRARLVLHLTSESMLLAAFGGALGLALGWIGVGALEGIAPDALPSLVAPSLDARVFAFCLAATALALVLFGLVPAVRLSRIPPADVLRSGGRGSTADRRLRRVRDGLAVAQVSVAVVLLVGAGLLLRSWEGLRDVSLGIEAESVLTFEVHLPDERFPDGARRDAFHRSLQRRIEALPEVEAVGATSWLPVNGRYHIWSLNWSASGESDDDAWHATDVRVVSGEYFRALGIDLLVGEAPSSVRSDDPAGAWINRRIAEEVFADADPVGQVVSVGGDRRRVIGVVEDVPHDARGRTSRKTYIPHAQFADDRNWALTQVVRTRGEPEALVERIRAELAALDPELVLYRPRPFTRVLAEGRARDRFATTLMATFAALGLLLAGIGTYAVLANGVTRRRTEIGIRMALGADVGRVLRMVVRHAVVLGMVGTALGLGGAWILGRTIRSLLFGVAPGDPAVHASAAALVLLLTALAGWLPARRATRVDPARTLQAE